ncbi:ATP synthase F1 subunit delta [bacterium]|nr:ATP synthase F1 subunit delta [bacterium]
MATPGKVANRYAKAIFDSLKDNRGASSILGELEKFAGVTGGHKDLSIVFASPGFSVTQKEGVVSDIAAKMGLSPEATKILTGLATLGRASAVGAIVERLRVRLLENEGIAPIEVWTAEALPESDRKPVEDKFTKVLGKKVRAQYSTNPAVVGGLKVVAGGRTFDGTVSGWLDSLSETLVEGEV